MSYITGVDEIIKGERGEIFFDKDQFLFATNFATDRYFENELNWKRIALHYKDSTSSQRQIVILKDLGSRGWFAPSELSRTGTWELQYIQIYDKQNDFFQVERDNIPSPENFSITVQRKIAPSSVISSIETVEGPTEFQEIYSYDYVAATGLQPYEILAGPFTIAPGVGTGAILKGNSGGDSTGIIITSTHASATDFGPLVMGDTYKLKATVKKNVEISGLTTVRLQVQRSSGQFENGDELLLSNMTVGQEYNLELEFVAGSINSLRIFLGTPYPDSVEVEVLEWSLEKEEAAQIPGDSLMVASDEGAFWREGFKCKIWSDGDGAWLTSDIYEIVSIEGDNIQLDKDIEGDIAGKSLRLRFPSYSQVEGVQKSLYYYVGEGY